MLRFISLAALALAAFAGTAYAQPGTHSVLATPDGTVKGIVEVSPTAHDVLAPDTFDVQGTVNVHGLAPNTDYKVLRWVDFNPDGNCTGTARLLPGNPTLTTSAGGAGALHFEISSAAISDGTSFDVIWRVVDAATGATVLESDCLTVTAK
jgi:hypothetical protein